MLNTTGRCECWLIPLMLFKLHSLDRRISLRWFNQATCAISPIEKILWKLTSPPQRSRILTPNVSNWSPSPFNDKSSLFLAVEQGESCHWVLRAIHYFLPLFFFFFNAKNKSKTSMGECFRQLWKMLQPALFSLCFCRFWFPGAAAQKASLHLPYCFRRKGATPALSSFDTQVS